MRLLLKRADGNEVSLTDNLPLDKIPRYAILSHTWGSNSDEVTYRDLMDGTGKDKVGYKKIQFCAEQAKRDGLDHFWVDTCCIDKSDPIEVQRSINSMFRWYRNATRCYVYLSNTSIADGERNSRQPEPAWDSILRGHRWFTRGWTLQELLAPASVEFFTEGGQRLGDKLSLATIIHEITGIPIPALLDNRLSRFDIEERFKWAEKRETTYEEDWAYCLLGIFGVFMLPNYGERKDYAVRRLRKEIEASERPGRPENRPNPSIMVPFSRDEDFVKRQALLDQMSQNCGKPGSRTALVGLGGVGKSQLAIEYAYRIPERSPKAWVFWVHASNAARFEQGFREIAAHLKIPGQHDPKADIFQLVHDWLGDERNGRWVLILDNLDNAGFLTASCVVGDGHHADIDDTNLQPLIRCLPQCQHGSILVTSRSREAASQLVEDRCIIAVDPMGKEDALTLLQRKLCQHEVGDGMDELTTALEYMPLAIVQAAAYISQTWPPCSVQQYLDKFRKSDRKKAGLLSYESGKLRRDASAKNSILITWQISFDHIREIRPSAVHVLSLMSFCDRQGIPASLLRGQDGETKRKQEQDERPRQGNVDGGDGVVFRWGDSNGDNSDDNDGSSGDEANDKFKDDIMVLRNFSFISTNRDGKTFEMHRLVQLATLEWLEAYGQQDHWRHRFLRRLCERLPTGEYENWVECRALFPHAKSAAAVAPKEEALQDWATVLYKAAWYAWRIGNGAEAEKLATQAMRARKKVLGQEQNDTLDAISMVALVHKQRGRWKEAELLEVQVMETEKRVLGSEHPHTLVSMANLALTYGNQGRWAEAESLFIQVMETSSRVIGSEHPHTLVSMANLALTYRNQGRWAEAESLFIQVMETEKRVLGSEHPSTLTSMGNLASTYRNQGRWAEAESLFIQVMETSSRVIGSEHPHTLVSMANLALTYGNQGRWAEAESLFIQVMETSSRVIGSEHPDTLANMANLALTYQNQGRWAEAESLIIQVMETSSRVLGSEHPYTLTSMGNRASTYRNQGRWAEAESLIIQVMETEKRVLGSEHPHTLVSMANLALTYRNQGRWAEAESLFIQVMETEKRVLGSEHPSTLTSMANLALTYGGQGRWEEAEELQAKEFEISAKKLGRRHPNTLISMGNLASIWKHTGRHEDALGLIQTCFDLRSQVLGVGHPYTVSTLSILKAWREDSSGPSKAITPHRPSKITVPQEGLHVTQHDKLIFKIETETGASELKHKWSWQKRKSIRAMGQGFRGVLDALKDGGKAGDSGKGKAVAK
ncbi:hypothetical protein B0H67DRAFT_99888 [Lasiosphaeris hirsuta]|uniref:Heterokaryon incompatibility domain-containing protein n=1 Tax=Lasiosphaeris hirsuta TaxID=260670 RepID=A0AA40AY74_9PEZI|nr:hypothetical protein B0H67DRAFT_99888 [Lasiosphaeris hirsuta]